MLVNISSLSFPSCLQACVNDYPKCCGGHHNLHPDLDTRSVPTESCSYWPCITCHEEPLCWLTAVSTSNSITTCRKEDLTSTGSQRHKIMANNMPPRCHPQKSSIFLGLDSNPILFCPHLPFFSSASHLFPALRQEQRQTKSTAARRSPSTAPSCSPGP